MAARSYCTNKVLMTSRKFCEMENPNLASPTDGPKSPSPTSSLAVAVYDDIGLDPRAAEKLKILVNDLNQHVARLSQVTVENPDGTVRDGFSDEFSVRTYTPMIMFDG